MAGITGPTALSSNLICSPASDGFSPSNSTKQNSKLTFLFSVAAGGGGGGGATATAGGAAAAAEEKEEPQEAEKEESESDEVTAKLIYCHQV